MSKEVLLAYPDFSKPFEIHTDASHTQLGAVIAQEGQPIAFYSRKLNPAQTRYTTTERELLAICETLKEFRNILLGYEIRVYCDHKNLTYKNFNTERVMRWRLLIEEFGADLTYIKGEDNIVADALSRLELLSEKDTAALNHTELLQLFTGDTIKDVIKNKDTIYPLRLSTIEKEQNKDKELMKAIRSDTNPYTLNTFRGGGKDLTLLCKDNRIVVPKTLQRRIAQWYHVNPIHPGKVRTTLSIKQHFYWKNMKDDIERLCKTCPTCQRNKRTTQKWGHVPPKKAEYHPWDQVCVNTIGPYTIHRDGMKPLVIQCLTAIDPATGWIEVFPIENKRADSLANLFEIEWLCRYPWPQVMTLDNGKEFMKEFAETIKSDYGIKMRHITKRNPQANSMVERCHQTIGNVIRTFTDDFGELDEQQPWQGIIAAAKFACHVTIHTTLNASPTQLVFGRDAILNSRYEANWEVIRDRKQKRIDYNNKRENAKRIAHVYNPNDKVLLRDKAPGDIDNKYGKTEWEGPYTVVRHNRDSGTVYLRQGPLIQPYNIRKLKPYNT